MSNSPQCIVCGRPIKKRMRSIAFYPASLNGKENGERSMDGQVIYLEAEDRPTTKEEAQRYTNYPITRVVTDHTGAIWSIYWWAGEYEDEFFDTLKCAAKQGRASAQHGDRYTWKTQ